MSHTANNIFSSAGQESISKIEAIAESTKEWGAAAFRKLNQIVSQFGFSQETTQKISENLAKAKDFFNNNKEVILGVTLIAGLYIANERRAKTLKMSRSKHIHSLTTNPNQQLKRSGSNKKQLLPQDENIQKLKSPSKSKPKKPSNPKLLYLRAFISEAEEQEDSYIRSDEEDKENPDLSTSTRRTESMISDIECMKKKKRTNLQPILDLVEEEEQTQDRVFFEMYRTYRES